MSDERPRGRPAGKPGTRDRILAAALESFTQKGFQGTSLRGVAAAAGVDDGTVRHHFGDKIGLLLAAMRTPVDPREIVATVVTGGREGMGRRVIAAALRLYDSPMGIALKEAVLAHPERVPLLAALLADQLAAQSERIFPDLPPRVRKERIAVVQTIMAGLAVARLVLEVGPLAELPPDRVVALLGPVVQAAIDGQLDNAR